MKKVLSGGNEKVKEDQEEERVRKTWDGRGEWDQRPPFFV